jgi:uncharacterized protein with von Willebrand factor type A (vWA) domain
MAELSTDRSFTIDSAALVVAFATALRNAGIPSSPDRSAWLVEALQLVPPRSGPALYWACRIIFVTSAEQVARFDAVFDLVFGGTDDPSAGRGDSNAPDIEAVHRRTAADDRPVAQSLPGLPDQSTPPAPAGSDRETDDDQDETESFLLAASKEERLHDRSFATLQADELARIRQLVAALALQTPLRPGRRQRTSPRSQDRLDMRRTVRAAQRTSGDAVRLFHSKPRPRARSLVLLCDVSASMEPYTRVFLSFMQAAVVTRRAEAFIFATRLTRLTRHLAVRDPDRALERAAGGAEDWAGGTRLADGLRSFIDEHGRRGIARGAVVVIFSDGWAQDDPADVQQQMARLARLAYRIVWVNPRKAARGYEPLTGGMAAALPYCDAFVSGHNYRALQQLVQVISDEPAAPSTASSRRPALIH